MCTYQTQHITVSGSGKGATGWFPLTDASVYVDHPVHAPVEHALNIDFLNPSRGAAARVAVELTADAARELVRAINASLDATPPGLLEHGHAALATGGSTSAETAALATGGSTVVDTAAAATGGGTVVDPAAAGA